MKRFFSTLLTGFLSLALLFAATTESILTPTLPTSGGKYGTKVAVAGDYAFSSSDMITHLIGGKVRVFKNNNGTWAQSQEIYRDNHCQIAGNDASSYFGYSMDAADEWLAVGAPLWDSDCLSNIGPDGTVTVYKRVGETYVQQQVLSDPDFHSAERFGESVSISGEWLFVGASQKAITVNNTFMSAAGVVFIYRYDGNTGLWTYCQTITASDITATTYYGRKVEVDGTKALVSAPTKSVNNVAWKGTAYFLEFNGTTWVETQKITMANDSYVGQSLAISGNNAAIGTSSGKVYTYHYENNTWNQVQIISKSGSANSISMSGNYLAIDDPNFITNYKYTGAADIYKYSNGTWALHESIYPSDGKQLDYNDFANNLVLSAGKLVVGAPFHWNGTGNAYIYSGFSNDPVVNADFTPSDLLKPIHHDITFADASTAQFTSITSWAWDFDGNGVDDQVNLNANAFTHEFITPGVYPVRLTVSDGAVSSSIIKLITILSTDGDTCVSYLPVKGVTADKTSIAAWNTYAGAPESQKWGHAVPQPPGSIGWAYYYLGSSDYSAISADSKGAMHLANGFENWPNFQQALTDNGFTPEDVTISFGLMSLGLDRQNTEWSLAGDRETRVYRGVEKDCSFDIKINGEKMIGGDMPEFTMYIDYYAYLGGVDKISGKTDYARPYNVSDTSSQAVKNVAAAFMQDCEHFKLRFIFSSIQPANQVEFNANNRLGGFFEVQQGFILKACPCEQINVNIGDTLWVNLDEAKQLSATVNGGSGIYSYSWSPTTGLNDSTLQSPTVTFALPTEQSYTLAVTDSRGCQGSATKQIIARPLASIHGTVYESIDNHTLSSIKLYLDGGHQDSTETSKDGHYSFDHIIPARIYTITAKNGNYQPYTSQGLWFVESESKEFDITLEDRVVGITNTQVRNEIFAKNGMITVRNAEENTKITILNSEGKTVYAGKITSALFQQKIKIKGIYLIKLDKNTNTITRKMMVN